MLEKLGCWLRQALRNIAYYLRVVQMSKNVGLGDLQASLITAIKDGNKDLVRQYLETTQTKQKYFVQWENSHQLLVSWELRWE